MTSDDEGSKDYIEGIAEKGAVDCIDYGIKGYHI